MGRRRLRRKIRALKVEVTKLKTELAEVRAPLLSCLSCKTAFKQWREGPFENVCRNCWQKLLDAR